MLQEALFAITTALPVLLSIAIIATCTDPGDEAEDEHPSSQQTRDQPASRPAMAFMSS